jgi:hypothetical protein
VVFVILIATFSYAGSLLSCSVFAYPGKTEEKKLTGYLYGLCSFQKRFEDAAHEWSDAFDRANNPSGDVACLTLMRMYRDALEEHGSGNCRFGCAAVYLKLTELGFENYQVIVLINNNGNLEEHHCNIYRTKDGKWRIADFSVGLALFERKSAKYMIETMWASRMLVQEYVDLLGEKIQGIAIRNKFTNETSKVEDFGFLDIGDFIEAYTPVGEPLNILDVTIPEHYSYVNHPNRDQCLADKIQQVRETIWE